MHGGAPPGQSFPFEHTMTGGAMAGDPGAAFGGPSLLMQQPPAHVPPPVVVDPHTGLPITHPDGLLAQGVPGMVPTVVPAGTWNWRRHW